jgi:hypothetical protein
MSFFVAFSLLKKASNFFTNFWHSGDMSDCLPIFNRKINEFYLELGVLTKKGTVMLLIVLAEVALR